MKFSGEMTVNARRDAVFASLADARVFASLIDGVHELTPLDDTHFNAVLETRVAYMSFRFKVAVTYTEVVVPRSIAAKIEGAPLGVAGRLTAATRTELEEAGDDTRIRYEIDVALAGKLGSMGQPVLKAKAREMEQQFARNLRARFAVSARGGSQRSAAA